MSETGKRQMRAESRPSQNETEGSPLRVFALGAIVIIVVIAALLTAIRFFLFPVWEANSEGARQVATAQVQLSAAMTQEALTPVPTSTPVAAVATAPEPTTATPTALPAKTSVPAVEATSQPSQVGGLAGPVATVAPGLLATPTADQASEIAAAYEKYFDITSDALLSLDPNELDQVAAGESLAGLQQAIEQDRLQGRALQTNVEHDVYVIGYQGDDAQVADRYKDLSVYVDPVMHAPLPGQVAPASADVAPVVTVIYHMQRIDGTWKVVSGQRIVPQGTQ